MGGSSLCPEVLEGDLRPASPGYPELHVLDSTDPAQVKAIEDKIDLAKTLFIVSSKSGSTLEPNIFKAYFFERVKQALGADKAGSRFIAITDPGSNLEKEARARRLPPHLPRREDDRRPLLGALQLRHGARPRSWAWTWSGCSTRPSACCRPARPACPPRRTPAWCWARSWASLASKGIDKVTLVASPGIYDLGAWLEQLLAESTGKEGKGIIPVDRERARRRRSVRRRPAVRLPAPRGGAGRRAGRGGGGPGGGGQAGGADPAWPRKYDLAEEFFRWEIATAVAGAVLGINPFNQPDVEASKIATKTLTAEYEKTGQLPAEAPFFEGDGVKLFADAAERRGAPKAAGGAPRLAAYLKAHLDRLRQGDYFALLAYVRDERGPRGGAAGHAPPRARPASAWRPASASGRASCTRPARPTRAGPTPACSCRSPATTPRTCPCPGQKYTFGVVKAAQARGDFQVLAERAGGPCASTSARTWPPACGPWTRPSRRPWLALTWRRPHAARNDRPRPHGRQHGAAPHAGRAHVRRLRPLGRRPSRPWSRRAPTGASSLADS